MHRDLKPANVFLTADGRVKVLDFGLAKLRESGDPEDSGTPTASQTEPGRMLGTVGYMSPEHVAGRPVDARSDIFSLGCVLHQMVSGSRPFARNTAAETLAAILNEEPPELNTVPGELRRLIAHCLEKDPAARFQSASDLAFDLGALLSPGLSGSASAAVVVRQQSWPHLARWAAHLFTLVVVGAAALWLGSRRAAAPMVQSSLLPPDKSVFGYGWGNDEGAIAIAPNALQIAFVARAADGRTSLWVRPLGTLLAQRLEGSTSRPSRPRASSGGSRPPGESGRSGAEMAGSSSTSRPTARS